MSFPVLPSRAVRPWLQPASARFSWSPLGPQFPLDELASFLLIRHGILLRAFSPPEPKKPQTTDAHTQRIAVTSQLGFCAVVYSI